MRTSFLIGLAASVVPATAIHAHEQQNVYVRVVDVGNAMCVVAKAPGDHYMLYDAGHWNSTECEAAVKEIAGDNRLDLVVLSHSDADHIAELPEILADNPANTLVYTGKPGTSQGTWPNVLAAINNAEVNQGTHVRDLSVTPLPNMLEPLPGTRRADPLVVSLGDATVTFVAGWPSWDEAGDPGAEPDESERRNAISIVVRLEYNGQSILLTGDTVGRRRGSEPQEKDVACRDAERWMVWEGNAALNSDVLVGQHHGGENSSSFCFIDAVSPDYVVFTAGNGTHDHPRATVAARYLLRHIPPENLLRTDRGDDDEPGDVEWDFGMIPGCADQRGDDDVEIILPGVSNASPVVRYRSEADASCVN